MRDLPRFMSLVLACGVLAAQAQDAAPALKEVVPKSGSGRVVVVISGRTGPSNYTAIAQDLADAGYDVELVDGNALWGQDGGDALLQGVIERALASPHAVAGKVGVVGFSLGGAAALAHAARLPGQVATVVVMYPLTSFIQDPKDFVGRIRVPVLMLAGTADADDDCCTIERARALAEAARADPDAAPLFELHEYAGAGHGFDTNPRHQRALASDSRDRTIAQLRQYLLDR